MYRTGGIIALVIGITLACLWAFLPFVEDLGYRVSVDDGRPVWTRIEIQCPDPWSVVVEGERPQRDGYAMTGDECIRPARTLLSGAFLAVVAGLALAVYGWARGPKPPPEPIEPLSVLIRSDVEEEFSSPS